MTSRGRLRRCHLLHRSSRGSDRWRDSSPLPADPASPWPDLLTLCLELAARVRLVVGHKSGGACSRPAALGERRGRGEVSGTQLRRAGGKAATAWSRASLGPHSMWHQRMALHACCWGTTARVAHGDLLWAWLSICNGSMMSSSYELRAVVDDEQLHIGFVEDAAFGRMCWSLSTCCGACSIG